MPTGLMLQLCAASFEKNDFAFMVTRDINYESLLKASKELLKYAVKSNLLSSASSSTLIMFLLNLTIAVMNVETSAGKGGFSNGFNIMQGHIISVRIIEIDIFDTIIICYFILLHVHIIVIVSYKNSV